MEVIKREEKSKLPEEYRDLVGLGEILEEAIIEACHSPLGTLILYIKTRRVGKGKYNVLIQREDRKAGRVYYILTKVRIRRRKTVKA